MKLSEIIFDGELCTASISKSTEISGIAIKARNVKDGYLYFVTNPKKADFDSLKARPVCIVCSKDASIPDEFSEITERCENPLILASRALARFSNIDFEKIKFIGITGTNGKTTTAVMLKKILQDAGRKVGYIGTGKIEANGKIISDRYYSMTTPEPDVLYPAIKALYEEGCDVIVMEVSSHALKLGRVEPIRFEYGVFTNLSAEHTDFHPDMEDYFTSKLKLMSCSKVGVFNVDDTYSRLAARRFKGRKITVGALWKGDVYARDIESHGFTGIGYVYRSKSFSFMMRLNISGIFNVYNSMAALAIAIDMGVAPCKAKESLKGIKEIDGRFQGIEGDVTVIIDYAHTPLALENLLKSINTAKKAEQKLITVFGCGGERDRSKRPLMAKIAEKYSDAIYVTSDNPRGESPEKIINDIKSGFLSDGYICEPKRECAIRTAILSAKSGDVIAVVGKGAERYSIDADGYHEFDERKIITDALKERENGR